MIPRLPRSVWVLLGGESLASVGTGLTLPFLLIYLHRVRGIEMSEAAAALAWLAAVGLVGNPLGGWLSDRIGARRTLTGGLLLVSVAALAIALVREPWHAFAATGLFGLGAAVVWPAQDALLATLAGERVRARAFSTRYATMNAGIGAGSVLGALLADVEAPLSFELLFLLQALTFLIYAGITTRLPNPSAAERDALAAPDGGWRAVRDDRGLRWVLPLVMLLFAVGYAQFGVAFPAYAMGPGALGSSALALAFTANTVTIVAAQLPMYKLLERSSRSRALALAGGIWAIAWLTALSAGQAGGGTMAATGFVLAMVLFGLGETILAPTLGPLVNDLASEALRGRYNGASALASTGGFIIGPIAAGAALDAGHGGALLAGLAAACVLAVHAALRLERHLPARFPAEVTAS
jgi:MFS family permease